VDFNFIIDILRYFSISILFLGSLILIKKNFRKFKRPILCLIFTLLMIEAISLYINIKYGKTPNLIFICISQFLSIAFLSYTYCKELLKVNLRWFYLIPLTTIIILVTNVLQYKNLKELQFYSDIIGCLIILSLAGLYFINIIKNETSNRLLFWFNSIVFLFFSIELIITLTLNFLVNAHLNWVAPIWIFRALVMQLFYLSLIYYGWKTGKDRV